jgi:hypothetical protein
MLNIICINFRLHRVNMCIGYTRQYLTETGCHLVISKLIKYQVLFKPIYKHPES